MAVEPVVNPAGGLPSDPSDPMPSSAKRGLGRGLDALIPGPDAPNMGVAHLPVSAIGHPEKGEVTLSNLNPPESYTIAGEGKGGIAGFAKGGADVKLTEEGAETLLAYTVRAEIGGKLAQLGSRLIDSTSKKLAAQFFADLGTRLNGGVA